MIVYKNVRLEYPAFSFCTQNPKYLVFQKDVDTWLSIGAAQRVGGEGFVQELTGSILGSVCISL